MKPDSNQHEGISLQKTMYYLFMLLVCDSTCEDAGSERRTHYSSCITWQTALVQMFCMLYASTVITGTLTLPQPLHLLAICWNQHLVCCLLSMTTYKQLHQVPGGTCMYDLSNWFSNIVGSMHTHRVPASFFSGGKPVLETGGSF